MPIRVPTIWSGSVAPETVAVGVPVSASTMQSWTADAAHLLGAGIRRAAHVIVAHDITTPLAQQSPKGATPTVRLRWRVSPRAQHAVVAVRYQATAEDDTHAIAVELRTVDPDEIIDPGWVVAGRDLVAADHEDGTYPIRWVDAPPAINYRLTVPEDPTGRRPLICDGHDGELLEARITGTDVRIIAATLFEQWHLDIEQDPS